MNTEYIMKALSYYASQGYTPVEVSIVVDKDVSAVTRPESSWDTHHSSDTVYVASAEQSFLQLIKDGDLPSGNKLMALTPCLRDEEKLDALSYLMFLKLELFVVGDHLVDVLTDANRFFNSLGLTTVAKATYMGFDLLLNGIEIGSYGVREYMGITYTYGTGIAEPRLSAAVSYGL